MINHKGKSYLNFIKFINILFLIVTILIFILLSNKKIWIQLKLIYKILIIILIIIISFFYFYRIFYYDINYKNNKNNKSIIINTSEINDLKQKIKDYKSIIINNNINNIYKNYLTKNILKYKFKIYNILNIKNTNDIFIQYSYTIATILSFLMSLIYIYLL